MLLLLSVYHIFKFSTSFAHFLHAKTARRYLLVSSFNEQFVYAILIIAIGYVLKRLRLIQESDGEGLARIIFNLTLPALIIVSFSDIELEMSLFLLAVLAFFYGVVMAILGLFIFRKKDRQTKGMLTMLIPGFNIGLFAYPLVEGIWGKEGIKYFGMFDVGNAIVVFGVMFLFGSLYASDDANLKWGTIAKKLFGSLPLLTYIIVCSLVFMDISIPPFIVDVAQVISPANMPLSFLLLGIYLHVSFAEGSYKRIVQVLALRYGIGLVAGALLFIVLPFTDMFKYTVLLGLILPVSMTALPYSVEFGYDSKFIGTVSNITILMSFILLWLITNIVL